MKKLSLVLFVLLAFGVTALANPVSDLDRDVVKEDCKTALFKHWGNHYNLIRTLLNAQMKQYDYLASQPSNSISDGVMQRLLDEWYPSINLIKILYDADMKAYKELQ
jgi:hypothetical protein